MNADESQTPEPVDESLVKPEEQSPRVEPVQDSAVESSVPEKQSTGEPPEDSGVEFLVELEEISKAELEEDGAVQEA